MSLDSISLNFPLAVRPTYVIYEEPEEKTTITSRGRVPYNCLPFFSHTTFQSRKTILESTFSVSELFSYDYRLEKKNSSFYVTLK